MVSWLAALAVLIFQEASDIEFTLGSHVHLAGGDIFE